MRNAMLLITASLTLSACSLFSVYKIDIPQGAPLTSEQVKKVQVGMSQDQVVYLLGSPTLNSTLEPNRWDYLYDFTPGTYGRKARIPATHRKQRLSVFFDDRQRVTKIEGAQSIPAVQRTVPITDDF